MSLFRFDNKLNLITIAVVRGLTSRQISCGFQFITAGIKINLILKIKKKN